jgi:hypothetical protein
MKKPLSAWQKVGLFAGIGCLTMIVLIVGGVAIAVVWARSTVAQLGDTTPKPVERSIAIAPAEAAPATVATKSGAAPARVAGMPLKLIVDLQEGSFEIKPGPPGENIQVQGRFSEALYELTERKSGEGEAERTTIRFRSKAPWWARALSGIGEGDDEDQPHLTVLIPAGVPIDLSLRLAMGESRTNLGGLTLTELGLDLSMGDHQVDFREPVVGGMQRLRLNARMGNIRVENLGNARAKTMDTTGSMGNLTADLGGAWQPGDEAEMSFTHSMGEVVVNVPSAVRLEADVRDSENRNSSRPVGPDDTTDPKAPLVKVRVSSSMGEGRVTRY